MHGFSRNQVPNFFYGIMGGPWRGWPAGHLGGGFYIWRYSLIMGPFSPGMALSGLSGDLWAMCEIESSARTRLVFGGLSCW